MAVLQGGGQNLPSPCVCCPKDPMWNRVKRNYDFAHIVRDNGKERCSKLISPQSSFCLPDKFLLFLGSGEFRNDCQSTKDTLQQFCA